MQILHCTDKHWWEGDLPEIISINLGSWTLAAQHKQLCVCVCVCVCGRVSACVMSVLWVGKGSLLRQTALWSTHQVSNCPLSHLTSRKPQKNNVNKLVCLTTLPALPSFPPASFPHHHHLLFLLLLVCWGWRSVSGSCLSTASYTDSDKTTLSSLSIHQPK